MNEPKKPKPTEKQNLSLDEQDCQAYLKDYHFENLTEVEFEKDFEVYALCMAGSQYCVD